jgi:cytochrome c oxidase subunit 4
MDIHFSAVLFGIMRTFMVKKNDIHILSYSKLAVVLGLLFGLTAVTIGISRIDMGVINIWVALLIASTKSSLVLLFFMHLKYESRLVKLSVIGTIVCLAVLIGFIFWDISFR